MASRTSIETQAVLHASSLDWRQFLETEITTISVLRAERDEGLVGKLTAFPDERLVHGLAWIYGTTR